MDGIQKVSLSGGNCPSLVVSVQDKLGGKGRHVDHRASRSLRFIIMLVVMQKGETNNDAK